MKLNVRTILFPLLPAFLSLLALATPVKAELILSADWEPPTYSNGGTPHTPPWTTVLGTPTPGEFQVTTARSSPFSAGSQSLVARQASSATLLTGTFAAAETAPLSIEFDFYIPTGGAANNPSFFLMGATSNRLLYLNLRNGGWLVNQKSGDGTGDQITPIAYDTWYNVSIVTTNAATAQFDITVTPFGGAAVTTSGLSFRNAGTEFGSVAFGTNNAHTGAAEFYLDNLSINAIPEPGTLGLAALACGALALRFGAKMRRP